MKWKSRAADRGFRNSTHFRVLAAVLCAALSMAVSVLLALDQHQPDSFRLLFLLPAVSSVFLFLFLLTAPEEYLRNIGVLLMLAELYIRCTITPLFMYLGDYNSQFAGIGRKHVSGAVALLLYELLWCLAAIHFSMRRNDVFRKVKACKQSGYKKLGAVLGLLTLTCAVIWLTVPAVRSNYRSLAEILRSGIKDNAYDYRNAAGLGRFGRILATLFTFLFSILRYAVPAFLLVRINRVRKSRMGFCISLLITALQLCFIPSAVATSLMAMCVLLILLMDLYPEYRKFLLFSIGTVTLTVCLLVFSITYKKAASWYGIRTIYPYISRLLNGYCTGVCNVASTFLLPERNRLQLLFHSLLEAVPFRSTLLPASLHDETMNSLFTSLPQLSGQIVSSIGCGWYFFSWVFAPLPSFVFAFVSTAFGEKYHRTANVWKKTAYLYMCVQFAAGLGIYGMPIVLFNWVQVGIPLLFLSGLAGEDT